MRGSRRGLHHRQRLLHTVCVCGRSLQQWLPGGLSALRPDLLPGWLLQQRRLRRLSQLRGRPHLSPVRGLWLELPERDLRLCHSNPDPLAQSRCNVKPHRHPKPNRDAQLHSEPEPKSLRDTLWAGRDCLR